MTEAPEKKNPLEQLEIRQKAERIWQGEEAMPRLYPYILPDYRLPFPHIGTEPQLFLDNYMVEWFYDVERVMERPRKQDGPVLLFNDFPWEGAGCHLAARNLRPRRIALQDVVLHHHRSLCED